jgi:hypothetical protein
MAWDRNDSLWKRKLRVAEQLRKADLFAQFEDGEKGYTAFTIHKVAPLVETLLNEQGLVSSWSTTRWERNGAFTFLEGTFTIRNVDNDEVDEVSAFGEAAREDDKGSGTALSTARKNAMIAMFNLGVGIDIETNAKRGQRPQTATKSDDIPRDFKREKGPNDYEIRLGKTSAIWAGKDFIATLRGWLNKQTSVSAVDDFAVANGDELKRFFNADKAAGLQMKRLFAESRDRINGPRREAAE